MPFVNELISEQVDKFDSEKLNEMFPGPHKKINRRTVDYGRNAVLTADGGVGVGHKKFKLSWNGIEGELVALPKETKGTHTFPNGAPEITGVDWLIESFKWPENHASQRNEFIKIMLDALMTYGLRGQPDWHGKVTVDIHPGIKLNL